MAQDFGQLPSTSQPRKTFALDKSLLGATAPSKLPSRSRSRRRFPILPVLGLVVLIVGVVAAVFAAQTNLDLRQWAWGGVKTNPEALKGQTMSLESVGQLATENKEAAKLFVDLTKTYYDADVVNINIPEFAIQGVVFKKYDVDLDRTFVFGRLENLPLIQAIPRMWLSSNDTYVRAGVGQLTLENDVPVGYFLSVLEGDDAPYTTLHFSYDENLVQDAPSASFLSIDFKSPEELAEAQQ